MTPAGTYFITLTHGVGEPSTLVLAPGTRIEPVSVGRAGAWHVDAADVPDIGLYLFFDGAILFAASADPLRPALLNGLPLPPAWTSLSPRGELRLGAARMVIHDEASMAAAAPPPPASPGVRLLDDMPTAYMPRVRELDEGSQGATKLLNTEPLASFTALPPQGLPELSSSDLRPLEGSYTGAREPPDQPTQLYFSQAARAELSSNHSQALPAYAPPSAYGPPPAPLGPHEPMPAAFHTTAAYGALVANVPPAPYAPSSFDGPSALHEPPQGVPPSRSTQRLGTPAPFAAPAPVAASQWANSAPVPLPQPWAAAPSAPVANAVHGDVRILDEETRFAPVELLHTGAHSAGGGHSAAATTGPLQRDPRVVIAAPGAAPHGALTPGGVAPGPAPNAAPNAAPNGALSRFGNRLVADWRAASTLRKVTTVLIPFVFVFAFVILLSPSEPRAPARPNASGARPSASSRTPAASGSARRTSTLNRDGVPSSTVAPPSPLRPTTASDEKVAPPASAAAPVAAALPALRPKPNEKGVKTPERLAVDAVESGNYALAAALYADLAAENPERKELLLAARILRGKARAAAK